MNTEREIKVRDAIKYCIENFDSQTATNRIVEFWKDELKLQHQQCNIANVVARSERCSGCEESTGETKIDMENNTSTNHENVNDANRLLAAGLRVKLHFAYTTLDSFLLPGFHFLPRKGDLIDLKSLINEKNYSDEELDKIYTLSWSVSCVNWGKDKFGVFAEITCEGE